MIFLYEFNDADWLEFRDNELSDTIQSAGCCVDDDVVDAGIGIDAKVYLFIETRRLAPRGLSATEACQEKYSHFTPASAAQIVSNFQRTIFIQWQN